MRAEEDATRSLAQAGRREARCITASFYGETLTDLGDHAGAVSVLRETLGLAERRRDALWLPYMRVYLARVLARIAPLDQLAEPEHLARASPRQVATLRGAACRLRDGA